MKKKTRYSDESIKRIVRNIITSCDPCPCITANCMQSVNHQNCCLILEEKTMSEWTELEKKLITPDLNIRRYLNGEKIDLFHVGQMASLNYPNGYGHGTRVHSESIALTTGQNPCVKVNGENKMRIRKLVPLETCRLMGFTKMDHQAMRDIGMTDSQIYHCCGDSIVVPVLMAIFGQMIYPEEELKQRLENYIELVKGE